MLGWIVDRRHVSEDYGTVRRYVISRLKRPGYKTFKSWPRSKRRQFLQFIYDRHHANREMYRGVMSGRWL